MADEQNPSNIGGTQHSPETPGGRTRAISTGLMESGFATIGSALSQGDSNISAAWRDTGSRAAQANKNRWDARDFETFQAEHVTPYKEGTKGLMVGYRKRKNALLDGTWLDSNGNSLAEPLDLTTYEGRQRALEYRGQLDSETGEALTNLTVELSEAGAKYINNPMIDNQIQKMYEGASSSLSGSINPEGTLKAAEGVGMVTYREKAGDAALMHAKSSAAGSRPKKITGMPDAYTQLGAARVPGWILGTPEGNALLKSPSGEAWTAEARGDFEAEVRRRNPTITEEELGRLIDQNSVRIRQLSVGKAIKATLGDDAAAAVAAYAPVYFPDPAGTMPSEVAIKGRITPNDAKANIKDWEKLAMNQLHAEVAKHDAPPTVEKAIETIMEKWLPAAMRGDLEDENVSHLTAATNSATRAYRTSVTEAVREYLQKYWDRGEEAVITRGLYPEKSTAKAKSETRIRGRRAVRRPITTRKGILPDTYEQ